MQQQLLGSKFEHSKNEQWHQWLHAVVETDFTDLLVASYFKKKKEQISGLKFNISIATFFQIQQDYKQRVKKVYYDWERKGLNKTSYLQMLELDMT